MIESDWEAGQVLIRCADELLEQEKDLREAGYSKLASVLRDARLTIGDTFNALARLRAGRQQQTRQADAEAQEAMKCRDCDQPTLPKGETKRPNEYDHASGCPQAAPSGGNCIGIGGKFCSCPPCWERRTSCKAPRGGGAGRRK